MKIKYSPCHTNKDTIIEATGADTLRIDGEISFRDLTRNAVKEIDRLGPFGCENRRPVFMATQVTLAAPPKKMGEGERHLSLLVRQFGQSFRAIAFGKAEWADPLAGLDKPFSIAFQPIINHFRGQENVELQLMDWQP